MTNQLRYKITVNFSTNSGGFLSRKCSSCNLSFQTDKQNDLLFCPFCKNESDSWLTERQSKYGLDCATYETKKNISRNVGSIFGKSAKLGYTQKPFPLIEGKNLSKTVISKCCTVAINYSDDSPKFCPKCGFDL